MELGSAVEVWWAATDAVHPGQLAALSEELDDATRQSAARMAREEDRARSVLAHALARRVVAARTGVSPRALVLTRHCAACGESGHGKPSFTGAELPEISLSHAGPLAVVAVAPAGTAVGVDVELPGRGDWALVRRHTFTDEEWTATTLDTNPDAARLTLWAIKEAVAKATGHGLELGLARVAMPIPLPAQGGGWATARISGTPSQPLTGATLAVACLSAPRVAGAALAVASANTDPGPPPLLRDGNALLAGS